MLPGGTSCVVFGTQKRDATAVLPLYLEKLGPSVFEEGKSTGATVRKTCGMLSDLFKKLRFPHIHRDISQ